MVVFRNSTASVYLSLWKDFPQNSSGQLRPRGGHRSLGYVQGTAARRATPPREKKLLKCVFTLIRTSPAFGGATSTSSIESGLPRAQATAALHLITWKQPRGLCCREGSPLTKSQGQLSYNHQSQSCTTCVSAHCSTHF